MKGYIADIEQASRANENFRQVLYTDKNLQLVVMSLQPYTLYAPPNHKDGVIHKTKADAEADEAGGRDRFNGKTTEG